MIPRHLVLELLCEGKAVGLVELPRTLLSVLVAIGGRHKTEATCKKERMEERC